LAVRGGDRDAAAFHARKEDRRRLLDLDRRNTRLVLLRQVALEVRPVLRARDDFLKVRHHLAAVARSEREGIRSRKEGRELVARPGVEEDRLRPSFTRAEHVAVAESAACRE